MTFSLTEFTPVADRCWRATAEPATVTIGLVAGDSGCLVIDTGSTPAQGREIRDAAERTAGVPVIGAVATHAHWDHLYGLAAFADVATYGHASIAASVAADPERQRGLDELGLREEDLHLPDHTFHLGTTVDLGRRLVEIVHFGPAHTPGDAAVFVPDARAVFVGDLLEEAGPPWFGPESSLAGWPLALDGVLGTLRHDSVIVPGHGATVDQEFAVTQRGQIAGVYLQLEYLFTMGATPDDVLARGEWDFPTENIAAAVPAVYDSLKAKGKIGRQLRVLH